MTTYVALLRAVNVGGTGKLAMTDLKRIAEEAGGRNVRTYIASGNVVLQSARSEAGLRAELERRLEAHAGRPVGVIVRTAAEMAAVVTGDPFPDRPGNRTVALFTTAHLPADALAAATGQKDEELRLAKREIYISYGEGMARSRLRIPAAAEGTARNMNTVAKLAEMAAEA